MATLHVSFPLPDSFRDRIGSLDHRLRQEPSNREYRREYEVAFTEPDRVGFFVEADQLISDMADQGIDYFFVRSLEEAKVGAVLIKGAKMGLQAFKGGLVPLLRQIVQGLEDAQLMRILDFMGGIFVEVEE